ncbi:MAG: FliH/SctL family protein [Bryobacteraceae bacterium]
MSCKIITGEQADSARPLMWPATVPDQSELRLPKPTEPQETAPRGRQPEQVSQLHNRIIELEQEMQKGVRQAHENGFREGERAGREKASAELQPSLERLGRSLLELASLRSRIRRETEADLVTLAIAIAKRVLHREISVDPEAIQGVVKAALQKMQARDVNRIRVHPSHERHLKDLFQKSAVPGVQIFADPALQCGDLIVETKRGDLDASLDTQLQEIERGFADRIAT